MPRYLLVTDFARLAVHDLEPTDAADLFDADANATAEFALEDLHKHVRRFAFIAGYEPQRLDPEDPANLRAVSLLANLHDRLEDGGYRGHDLQRFMVRVLFCLFAEDTGIFEPLQFENFRGASGRRRFQWTNFRGIVARHSPKRCASFEARIHLPLTNDE